VCFGRGGLHAVAVGNGGCCAPHAFQAPLAVACRYLLGGGLNAGAQNIAMLYCGRIALGFGEAGRGRGQVQRRQAAWLSGQGQGWPASITRGALAACVAAPTHVTCRGSAGLTFSSAAHLCTLRLLPTAAPAPQVWALLTSRCLCI